MVRRFFCVSLMRDTASAALRCVTCDTVRAAYLTRHLAETPEHSAKILEQVEHSAWMRWRKKLCHYLFRGFLDVCGMNRKQIWHKIRPWMPATLVMTMLALVLLTH